MLAGIKMDAAIHAFYDHRRQRFAINFDGPSWIRQIGQHNISASVRRSDNSDPIGAILGDTSRVFRSWLQPRDSTTTAAKRIKKQWLALIQKPYSTEKRIDAGLQMVDRPSSALQRYEA